jgi:hypothetical protein
MNIGGSSYSDNDSDGSDDSSDSNDDSESDDSSDSNDDNESDDSSDSDDDNGVNSSCHEQLSQDARFAGAMALQEEILSNKSVNRSPTPVASNSEASPTPRTDTNGHPLSEYEISRVRKIYRNEQRLKSLGLLTKPPLENKSSKKSREKKNWGPPVRSSVRIKEGQGESFIGGCTTSTDMIGRVSASNNKQGSDNRNKISLGHDPPLLSEGHKSSTPSRNPSNINTKSSNGKEKKTKGGGDDQPVKANNEKLSSKTALTKVKSPKSLVVDEDEEGVYKVQKILKCEKNGDKNTNYSPDIMVFKVQWVGYSADDTSWEPKENLNSATGEYISCMYGEGCVIYLTFSEI